EVFPPPRYSTAPRKSRLVVLVFVARALMAERREASRAFSLPTGVTPKIRSDSEPPETSRWALDQIEPGWSASHCRHSASASTAAEAGKVALKKPIPRAGIVR